MPGHTHSGNAIDYRGLLHAIPQTTGTAGVYMLKKLLKNENKNLKI